MGLLSAAVFVCLIRCGGIHWDSYCREMHPGINNNTELFIYINHMALAFNNYYLI